MIRAILALMRRAERAQPDPAAAERQASRALRLRYLEQADDLRAEARQTFRDAMRAESFGERYRLYSLALAQELRAEAFHALAGGDAETAAKHKLDAEHYARLAGEPQPIEAAHA